MEKNKTLLILKYLYEASDTDQPVSTKQIKQMLAQHGFHADTRTIDSIIEQLVDHGYDISVRKRQGTYTSYYVNCHLFETAELKLLIDAVSASQFISSERAGSISERLASLSPADDRGLLLPIAVPKHRSGILALVDTILKAIRDDLQISFQMYDYGPDQEKRYRRNGKAYVFSPYDLIWVNDRYYLVGYDEYEQKIKNPRVDHLTNVRILTQLRSPAPEEYSISSYYNEIYKACSGPEYDVTIECANALAGKFIDRFGLDYEPIPVDEEHFSATVKTTVSNTFFGWILQYAGDMNIVGPTEVIDRYRDHLNKAISMLPAKQ